MFSLRAVTTLADKTIAHGLEVMSEGCEMRGDVFHAINHWDVAAALEKADETADAADVVRVAERGRAVMRAATPVPRETIDNRVVHAGDGNATSVEPNQEVSRHAALVPETPRRERATQIIEKCRNQCVVRRGRFSFGPAVKGRVLGRGHLGPFGLREKGP